MDEDDNEERLVQQQINFLRTRSPDDWHRYAFYANWNERLDVLYWIVKQPNCDKATASLIFWRGEPTGYDWEDDDQVLGEDEYAVEPLLKYIAIRFNTTGFSRSEIAYDFLEATGHDSKSPRAAAITAGRLGDLALLKTRQQASGNPKVAIHNDLSAMRIHGRKVGGFGDQSDFYDQFPGGD